MKNKTLNVIQDILKISEFQKEVYKIVCSIPRGQTRSYQWVARRIGNAKLSRAVGAALARNPLPLYIPCHRVILANGQTGSYQAGSDLKHKLLDIESVHK